MVSPSELPIRERISDAAIQADDFDSVDSGHERETAELWTALRDEPGTGYEVGLPVSPSPGPDPRLHVIWEPGAAPELATWHRRSEYEAETDE